jgi:hypothetical protein
MQKMLVGTMEKADELNVVGQAVLRAATDGKPRMRYPAGSVARKVAFIRRFAPASSVDTALRKQLRLDS